MMTCTNALVYLERASADAVHWFKSSELMWK
jgi:hypothetical protein